MKKKLFIGLTSAVALAAAAIITVSAVNATGTPESDLLAKNLEVLAQGESGGGSNNNEGKAENKTTYGVPFICCVDGEGTCKSTWLPCTDYNID